MLFDLIAELNQVLAHVLHQIATEKRSIGRPVSGLQHILSQVLLSLAQSQPTNVEVIPELQSIGIIQLIVTKDT